METEKQIKLRNGVVCPKGSEISWSEGKATIRSTDGCLHQISALGAARALGIETPGEEMLSLWCADSVVESVLGFQVEPDGYDPEGSPSWLLALDLI